MNRALVLHRFSRFMQARQASGITHVGPRWSQIVRSESNVVAADDPPTAPLSDDHEAGDGYADFSNYVEKHEDVGSAQALGGLSFILAVCYGIYRLSRYDRESRPPVYTIRECPSTEQDIPTMDPNSWLRERK